MFQPTPAQADDMTQFHSDEYIEFLRLVTPDNQHEHMRQLKRFNVAEDCPVFDGLFRFCQLYTGGSVGGAVRLNHGLSETVINWSGGLHHAKKSEASGFCYVNDIVLAILELLKQHQRVLYIDIDIHHGDGVEEAFYTTDRVMTVSFHKFGEYFPGTGHLQDIGQHAGKYYSVNVPLKDGIDDESYELLYKPLMSKVMEVYQPDAVVFQSGADSLSGDRLGCFNLSIKGHAECLKYMTTFNVPLLVLGGGGYTIRNVARCWAYETGCLLDRELVDAMPQNDYSEYFGPTHTLHIQPSNMENQNTREYLEGVRANLLQNLSKMTCKPSVPFHEVPSDSTNIRNVSVDVEHISEKSEKGFSASLDKSQYENERHVAALRRQQSMVVRDDIPSSTISIMENTPSSEKSHDLPISATGLPQTHTPRSDEATAMTMFPSVSNKKEGI